LGQKYRLKRSFWWVPYDPYGFLNARKIKYRISAYDHCRIRDIEQYANQEEWVQGTLVEEFSQEEIMEQNVKDLEKTLDLDSFDQVTFMLPQQVGEGTSATIVSQATQDRTSPTIGTTKGKEVIDTEQQSMVEQAAGSKEQGQGQATPLQIEVPHIPVLETPLNEERSKKRDWEETTPTSGSTDPPQAKRQRIDPQVEEETSEEIMDSPRREREVSQQTPTSSFQQEQERQHGMEVS